MLTRTPGPTALHPLRRMRLENASSFAGVELSRLQELPCRQQGNYTLTRDRTGVLRVNERKKLPIATILDPLAVISPLCGTHDELSCKILIFLLDEDAHRRLIVVV